MSSKIRGSDNFESSPVQLAYNASGWSDGTVVPFPDISTEGFKTIRLEGFHTGTLDGIAGNLSTSISVDEFLTRSTVVARGVNQSNTVTIALTVASVSTTSLTVQAVGVGTSAPLLTGIYGEY